ncbi:alpha/beta fold hydrolase [Streptomyces sp. NPDC052301]|uniref:alpha/beta fold hydrolase n=1 Tax=Streptomyces sp. NPDC052301 TaxID=3365687 RepID=UPI0037CDBCF2
MSAEHITAPAPETAPGPARIPRRPRRGVARASYLQHGVWALDQFEGAGRNSTYTETVVVRFRGALSVPALDTALAGIVDRHEVLRSVLTTCDGVLQQVVHEVTDIPMTRHDLTGVADSERPGRLEALVAEESGVPFDLARGPLLAGSLIRTAEHEHVLVLNFHHAVFDGWSLGVFFDELSELYRSAVENTPSALPELDIQYGDFAEWQYHRLTDDVLRTEAEHWRRQLAGLPPLLNLPTDRPRPAVQSFRGSAHEFRLSADLSKRLRRLCRGERATLFMGLLASFQILLGHCSGQSDVPVGSVIAGRRRSELEPLIGYFANTVVLRGRLDADSSFSAFLRRTRQACLDAHEHQELPFERVVDELRPVRSLSHNPLFQAMFVLQNSSADELRLPGLEAELAPAPNSTAKFDLSLMMCDYPSGLEGEFQYSTDLFDPATIERLCQDFVTLLEAVVADPEQPVSALTGGLRPPHDRSGEVTVRGYRLDPAVIEPVLAAHADVHAVAVAPYQDPSGGEALVAYVEGAGPEGTPDPQALRAYATQRLADFLVPDLFVPLPRLPRTATGAVDRAALPSPAAAPGFRGDQGDQGDEGRWTATEQTIADIWAELLPVDDFDRDENFFDLGGHSFAAIRLTDRIAEELGRTIAPTSVFQAPTIAALAALVDRTGADGGSRSQLVELRAGGSGRPLVLVHPLGGNLLGYTRLADVLDADRPVYGVEAAGLDGTHVPAETLEEAAASYLKVLAELGDPAELVLGGWSMGGVIAFEMARRLYQDSGRAVPVLMLDSYAPTSVHGTFDDARLVAWFADDWGLSSGVDLELPAERLAGLSYPEQIALLHSRAVSVGLAGDDTDVAVVERLMNVFRAHVRALAAYRPDRAQPIPVTLFSADSATGEKVAQDRGWSAWTTGTVTVRVVPGDHYSILREPQLARLAESLTEVLGAR